VHDDLFGLVPGGCQPSYFGQVSLAGRVVACHLVAQFIDLPSDLLTQDAEEGVGVPDLGVCLRQEACPGRITVAP
jgi:hypothetical protein